METSYTDVSVTFTFEMIDLLALISTTGPFEDS